MSGFTRPQTSLRSAFSHSTLSGVGGLCASPRWVCIAMRTRSYSFSTLRIAFSAPIHATAAIAPRTPERTTNASHDTPRVHETAHAAAQRPEVTSAPLRRMERVCARSTVSTGGGNAWRQMFPTSATSGAGYRASCFAGSPGGARCAGPFFAPSGSSAAPSRPFSA
jgi:hypothetical protein